LPLPDTPDFKSKEGAHIDVGSRFKLITIFFSPAWNYDEYWCGYIENGNRYIDFDKKTLDDGAAQASMIIPSGYQFRFGMLMEQAFIAFDRVRILWLRQSIQERKMRCLVHRSLLLTTL
jgi:hypothetical protein